MTSRQWNGGSRIGISSSLFRCLGSSLVFFRHCSVNKRQSPLSTVVCSCSSPLVTCPYNSCPRHLSLSLSLHFTLLHFTPRPRPRPLALHPRPTIATQLADRNPCASAKRQRLETSSQSLVQSTVHILVTPFPAAPRPRAPIPPRYHYIFRLCRVHKGPSPAAGYFPHQARALILSTRHQ